MATPASLEILLTADDILTGLYAGLVEGQTRRIESNDVPHPLPGGLLRIIASLKPNTDTGKFSCIFEDCQVQLKSKADMKRHLKNEDHTSEETKQAIYYYCPFEGCETRNSQSSNMDAHIETHSDAKNYPCTSTGCSKRYKSKKARGRHMWQAHNMKPESTRSARRRSGEGGRAPSQRPGTNARNNRSRPARNIAPYPQAVRSSARIRAANQITSESSVQSSSNQAQVERAQSITSVSSFADSGLFTPSQGYMALSPGSLTSEDDGRLLAPVEAIAGRKERVANFNPLDLLADLCAAESRLPSSTTEIVTARYDPVREAAEMQKQQLQLQF